MLEALERLEHIHGAEAHFYVWAVLREAGELSLAAESEQRRAAGAAEDAAYREALEVRAREGDEQAVAALNRQKRADMLGSIIRGWRRRREGGMPQRRPANAAAEDINPSRIFALLEKRGLVQRAVVPGLGSSIALTTAGRAALADRS